MKNDYHYEDEDFYGIIPHPRAIEIASYEFFWSSIDELAPFGSDEGYDGLACYEEWREHNPESSLFEFIEWTINGWVRPEDKYDESILDNGNIERIIDDTTIDTFNYIFDLDTSIISAGFGQLIIEGKIDENAKPFIRLALKRKVHPLLFDFITDDVKYINQVNSYCEALTEILEKA